MSFSIENILGKPKKVTRRPDPDHDLYGQYSSIENEQWSAELLEPQQQCERHPDFSIPYYYGYRSYWSRTKVENEINVNCVERKHSVEESTVNCKFCSITDTYRYNCTHPHQVTPYILMPFNHYNPKAKRKGGQIRFSSSQTNILEEKFTMHKYLSPAERKSIADSLDLSDKQVKTWFQNRRAKWRRSSSTSELSGNDETRCQRSKSDGNIDNTFIS